MSDGYRNGAFALGLVTGGGIVLNLFLWSAYYANKEGKPVTQGPESQKNHQDMVGSWDWFFTTFIDPNDSIAQWGMAVLSLAAVYLLWETLKASKKTLVATQNMAIETTRVGEAQIAAHLVPTNSDAEIVIETKDSGDDCYYLIEFIVRNCGATPAYNISSYFEIFGQPKREMWNAAKPKDAIPGQDVKLSLSQSVDITKQSTITHGAAIRLHVKFDTVFSAASNEKTYKTIFFDFGVIKTVNGRHVMLRHDYRDDQG